MLSGKTALITGASRGIGRGIAELLAEQGCFIGINYVSNDEAAVHTLDAVKNQSDGMLLKADISDASSVTSMIEKVVGKRKTIDILINNAGIYERNVFQNISPETWNKVINTNLKSCYHLCKQTIPAMNPQSRIIFISSQLAFKGSSHGSDYATSKAGMLGLMRSLALELAPIPIYVNAIAPGTIDTDIIAHYTDSMKKERINQIPLGRLGTPRDIAGVCLFLATELSSYITGETIHVNGGLYIH